MNPYTRAALFVIRLLACGLLVVGGILLGLDAAVWLARQTAPATVLAYAWKGGLILLGLALLLAAKPLARNLTKDFEP